MAQDRAVPVVRELGQGWQLGMPLPAAGLSGISDLPCNPSEDKVGNQGGVLPGRVLYHGLPSLDLLSCLDQNPHKG